MEIDQKADGRERRPFAGGGFFLSNQRRRVHPLTMERHLIRYARAAGLPRAFTCHCLCHACATHLLQNGADLRGRSDWGADSLAVLLSFSLPLAYV